MTKRKTLNDYASNEIEGMFDNASSVVNSKYADSLSKHNARYMLDQIEKWNHND